MWSDICKNHNAKCSQTQDICKILYQQKHYTRLDTDLLFKCLRHIITKSIGGVRQLFVTHVPYWFCWIPTCNPWIIGDCYSSGLSQQQALSRSHYHSTPNLYLQQCLSSIPAATIHTEVLLIPTYIHQETCQKSDFIWWHLIVQLLDWHWNTGCLMVCWSDSVWNADCTWY